MAEHSEKDIAPAFDLQGIELDRLGNDDGGDGFQEF